MTTNTLTGSADPKASLDRLEHLCAHLDHMLSEVFILTEEANLLCDGKAKSVIQRAGASTVIAMEFREEIIRHVEALQGA